MYIPIMKNRTQEMSVMSKFNNYFSDSIVPLIEIVKDYESRTSDNNENNVVTLSKLQNTLNGKRAFVEFFRYIDNEYQNTSIDIKGVKLAFDLSRDYFLYVQRMMEIKKFENFIPTISIKKGFILGHTDLEKLILDLKIENNTIAVRITDDVFDN